MNAHSIGLAAAQITSRGGEAKVMGVTSRGVFLSIEQRVLFVSFERWRGPLTINVDEVFDCAIGEAVRMSAARLVFPTIEIDLSAAEVWQSTPSAIARPIADQREALKQLASSVLARKEPEGFGPLLPHLLDLPEKQALSASEAALLARLKQLRESIHQQALDQTTTLIESLLGLGRGLTPSGDDVTIGLLLMLTHVKGKHPEQSGGRPSTSLRSAQDAPAAQSKDALVAVKHRVVESAYQRTTTISANLIECAANGEADERLINVIDGLVTGTPSRDDCVECVIGWGNSSGLDALIGMALAAA